MSGKGAIPEEGRLNEMYAAVLDQMLMTPQVKEQLMASQTAEKKWKTIQMYEKNFEGANAASHGGWGNREISLLDSISRAKVPDIHQLSTLRVSLQSANREFMDAFLTAGGVSVLVRAIETRLSKRPITELDIAILYEIVACCKNVMNNQVGMDGFLAVKGAVETIARSLRFEYRVYALAVLEILTVCCYYSDIAAAMVVGGMRLLARAQNEAPFACLARALVEQDIEVKSAVMQFVNRMVIGVTEVNHHALLRSELNAVLIGESYDQAVVLLDQELQQVARIEQEVQEMGEANSYFDNLLGRSSTRSASASSGASTPTIATTGSTAQSGEKAEPSPLASIATTAPTTAGGITGPSSLPGGIASAPTSTATASKPPPMRGLKRLSVSLMGFAAGSVNPAAATASTALNRTNSTASMLNPNAPETEVHVDRAAALRKVSQLRSKSIKSLHGPRAFSEQRVETLLRNPSTVLNMSDRDGTLVAPDLHDGIEIRTGGASTMTVNPLAGTMAGLLIASKNTEKMESKIVDLLGGKKTKRRWYEVDADYFKWCAGHEKEPEYKGQIPVSSITDIRNHTTDLNLLATNPHSFEFETSERVFALGCESAEEKEHWVTALLVSRDNAVIGKGSYRSHVHELTTKDLHKFAAMFKKQGAVFHSIAVEDRRAAMANTGLNMSDPKAVGDYLRLEALAAGQTDLLLAIYQELLLIPPSARGTWEAVLAGIKTLCERPDHDADAVEQAFNAPAVVGLLNDKAKEGGGAYSQMSKLAMAALDSEQEANRLRQQVYELQDEVAQLKALNDGFRSRASTFETSIGFGASVASARTVDVSTSSKTVALPDTSDTLEEGTDPMTPHGVDAGTSPPRLPPLKPPRRSTSGTSYDGAAVQVDRRYGKYVTMKKMLPEGAVRQKMTADGFSEAEIDAFFIHGPPMVYVTASAPITAPTTPAPAPADAAQADERYVKYVKMQKMLPEGAVRQKMTADGFSEAEIDFFFTNGPPTAVATPTAGTTAIATTAAAAVAGEAQPDERYVKYVKMQKMLPEGAVRQKMMTDGFTEGEIDSFFTNGPPMVAAAPSALAAPAAAAQADERYAKYVKMQKMLPEGAVRQKMMTDGFTEAEIDAFIATGPPMVSAAPSAPTAAAEPDERYAKYVKMQKMLPEGAVRQKMTADGFSHAEIDAFIANGPPMVTAAPSAPTPASEPDERYAKYVKMQKMLPEGAVRQKMMTDGFTEAEIDSFIANGPPMVSASATTGAGASPASDERYAKYVKMQKMLPEGAVRQKMTTDGFTPAEIDAFFANGPPAGASGGRVPPPPPPPPPAAAAQPEFGERYAKYVKMRSMLPEGAVRQKMMTDGFTQNEIDVFFGAAPSAAPAPAAPKGPSFTPLEAIRFAKYEKAMKTSTPEEVRAKMVAEDVSPEDVEKFFAVMAAQAAAKAAGGAKGAPAAPKTAPVDPPPEGMPAKPKITPNAKLKGIFWNKLKNKDIKGTVWHKMPEFKLPADEVKRLEELFGTKSAPTESAGAKAAKKEKAEQKGISVLDAQRTQNMLIIMGKVRLTPAEIMQLVLDLDPVALNQELCHTLYELHPSPEELAAVKQHKDPALLDNASQLVFQLNRIPRVVQRMECHEIAFSWSASANSTASQLGVIECACQELARSQDNLGQLLSMVLSIGNYLNGGTPRGQAYGVALDIFEKFSFLKATTSGESLMHFLARQAEQHNPRLLDLSENWVATWAAADISLKQLNTEVNNLDNLVNKMNAEFIRIKDTKENVGLDGLLEDAKGPAMNPLWRRLNTFLLVAKPRMAAILQQVRNVEGAVEREVNKYGDTLKKTADEDPCRAFFNTMASFARSFRSAADDNAAKRLAEEKAAQAKATAEARAAGRAGNAENTAAAANAGVAAGPSKKENIFGMFHSAQEASSDDVIAEFKMKMAKRAALAAAKKGSA